MLDYKYDIFVGDQLVGTIYDDQWVDAFVRGIFDKYFEDVDLPIKIRRYNDNALRQVPINPC